MGRYVSARDGRIETVSEQDSQSEDRHQNCWREREYQGDVVPPFAKLNPQGKSDWRCDQRSEESNDDHSCVVETLDLLGGESVGEDHQIRERQGKRECRCSDAEALES